MVFSTNQVIQFYNVTGVSQADIVAENGLATINQKHTSDTTAKGAYFLKVGNKAVPVFDKVLGVTYKTGAQDVLKRKALKVTVDDTNVVKGQRYVITLTYRDFNSDEDTYLKFADAVAKDNGSAGNATLIQDLAKSFLVNQRTEVSPIYELYDVTTKKQVVPDDEYVSGTNVKVTDLTASGFFVAEPVPDWVLGTFPERLLDIVVSQNTIEAGGLYVDEWIEDSKFKDYDSALGLAPIYNTHRIMDLQYFAYGEKGNSAWLSGWPLNIVPKDAIKENDSPLGYDVCVAHVARLGSNQNSAYQEFDLVFVSASTGENGPAFYINGIFENIDNLD